MHEMTSNVFKVFLFPPDGVLVHCKSVSSISFTDAIYIYICEYMG